MTFTILAETDKPQSVNYHLEFRQIFEDHLSYLRVTNVSYSEIDEQLAYKYEGNFYGFLLELGIPIHMHWVYLRINNMVNPKDFGLEPNNPFSKGLSRELIHISSNELGRLQKYYLSRKF